MELRPRDRTGAARSKRYRRRKQDKQVPAVTAAHASPAVMKPAVPTVAEPASEPTIVAAVTPDTELKSFENPVDRHGAGVTISTLIATLALAIVSAGFSITGMTTIFVGAFWPLIGMGVALELGKLSAVAWLGRHQGAPWLRASLIALAAVLMGLNAVGCYGFLAKAHIGHQVEGETAIGGRMAEIQGWISVQEGIVTGFDRQIAQIDNAIAKATDSGRTNAAIQLAADQKHNRTELVGERVRQGKALADLQVEKASIEGQAKVAQADLGPIRCLAKMIGADDQDVMRWFILVIAVLLDPAAVLLLLAASRR
jgi:hypothetical protein